MPSLWFPGFRHKQIKELFRWAGELISEGDRVWDVGANMGLFSLSASLAAGDRGQIICLEPDPYLVSVMHRTLRMTAPAESAPITLLAFAAAESAGTKQLLISASSRCLNHLADVEGNPRAGDVFDSVEVPCESLDSLAEKFDPPTLIKIDVEGAEKAVLLGARDLLAASRPRVIVEVSRQNRDDITDLLRTSGYKLFNANSAAFDSVDACVWNTYAVPA